MSYMSCLRSVKPLGTAPGKQRFISEKAKMCPGGERGTMQMIEYGTSSATSAAVRRQKSACLGSSVAPWNQPPARVSCTGATYMHAQEAAARRGLE